MTERAALYGVSVRPRARGAGPPPLGDLDGKGTALGSVLEGILDGFAETSADGARSVRTLLVESDGDDLFAVVQHGVRGLAADIVDPSGAVRLRQTPDDVQLVRCGCLFRLPPADALGRLAVHVSNGRGIKGLVEQGLAARFGAAFPDLRLAIEPVADGDALRAAVAADQVERLRLTRREPPGARSSSAVGKWVDAASSARVEVDVAVRNQGRLQRTLIERYLAGDSAAFGEIVSFAGLTFDAALVGVVLPDGTRRLFDLARPAGGRPTTRDLPALPLDADGEPTAAGLLAGLRAVLA